MCMLQPAVGVAKLRLGVEIRGDEWVTEYMLRGPPSLAIEVHSQSLPWADVPRAGVVINTASLMLHSQPPVWEAEMTMCEYFIHAHNAALDALDAFVLRRYDAMPAMPGFIMFMRNLLASCYIGVVCGLAGSTWRRCSSNLDPL
jgi:hypothetical protein